MRHIGKGDPLARFQPSQPDTFGPVVLAYQERLLGFAYRLLGNSADAEEVVQDAFVRAFRHLQRRPRDSWEDIELTPWLYRITLNLCRDRGKARARNRTEQLPEEAVLEGTGPDPSEEVTLRAALEDAIGSLPLGYRAVVLMRYVDHLTLEEMARALELPLGTVKARVHRGTRLLRQLLATSLGDGGGRDEMS